MQAIELYKEALDRLNAKIAFDPHNLNLTKTMCSGLVTNFDILFTWARLVETGAKKLTQLHSTIVAESSSGKAPTAPDSLFLHPFFQTSGFLSPQSPSTINTSFTSCSTCHHVDLDGSLVNGSRRSYPPMPPIPHNGSGGSSSSGIRGRGRASSGPAISIRGGMRKASGV